MEYPTLILLLTSVAHLAVGCFVFGRNPKGAVNRNLLLLSVLFALWALVGVVIWGPNLGADVVLWGRLGHAVAAFLWAGFVSLVLVYPEGETRTPLSLRLMVWAATGTVTLATVFTPGLIREASIVNGELRASYGPLAGAYYGCILLLMVWSIGEMLYRRKHSRGMRRVQIEYLLTGLALTGLAPLPTNMVLPLLGFHSGGWIGPVTTLIFSVMVAHAVVHHRLMGIRLVVGRGVANLLALAVAAALFLGLLWLMEAALLGSGPTTSVAALATALLFQPIRVRVQDAVLRYFHRPPYDYESTVRDASRTLMATLDVDAVTEYLLRTVCATLGVEHSRVLLHDRPAQSYRVRAFHSGWSGQEGDAPVPEGLTGESPLVSLLEKSREPVVREELESRPPDVVSRAVVADMEHFHAAVALPLYSGTVLWALLLVGPKKSGDAFTAQDLNLLSTLGAEAAGAIANAQLHEDAMQADRLATLGGLAAGIAHEVKNPLVAVRTFAELLPERHGDVEFRDEFSKIVLSEVDRIDRLIRQLLEYARPVPPRLEPVSLNRLIEDTLQLLGYQVSRSLVELVLELDPGLPPVMADASQLKQVIINVVLNAVQVMPNGGTLRITTRPLRSRMGGSGVPYLLAVGEQVEVVIANTGPRISEENLPKLFEPFFSTRVEGTGLGLSICKRIVSEHEGEIRAAVTDDGLTAFIIHLPAASPIEVRPDPPGAAVEPADLVGVAGGVR